MRLGILGGGQLGRMLALAAYPLGMRVRVFDPAPDVCAGQVAEHVAASFDDEAALERFAQGLDAVTFEWENVPVAAARLLASKLPFLPSVEALETAQDRLLEKRLFQAAGIETAPFLAVESLDGLRDAVRHVGLPAVLKTRRMGYDGKGQFVLRAEGDEEQAWAAVGAVPCILEGFVAFQRELSIIGIRGRDGSTRFYPLTENHHRDGILRFSLAPAPRSDTGLQAKAETMSGGVMDRLDYVGILAIELFEKDGRLLGNEIATRVHNSGHWTLDGAVTSQFENHVRAVTGLPLGDPGARGCWAMLNLIGTVPRTAEVLKVASARLHLYGKEPRPGRKLGHINAGAASAGELEERLSILRPLAGL